MKYVTYGLLFSTVSSLNTIDGIDGINQKVGSNVYWTNDMSCPDSLDPDNVIEYMIESTESNLSFNEYKNACEDAYQASQSSIDLTPCLQVTYIPGGVDYASDPDMPFYSCNAFAGTRLVTMDDNEWEKGESFGINP